MDADVIRDALDTIYEQCNRLRSEINQVKNLDKILKTSVEEMSISELIKLGELLQSIQNL